jgi:predicted unusual protein kinase regulating ubiquinone biosynthesis (AarF/ABC1/UbiB family)
VLLDFGATRKIETEIGAQYWRIFRAGLADETDALARVAAEIGFIDVTTRAEHRDQIIEMIRLVFTALRENRPFDFAHNDLSAEMQIKGNVLAESGFVPPPVPIDVLLLQRKFGGMFLLAKRLGARVDVVAKLEEYVQ